jgi:hypothetical protein
MHATFVLMAFLLGTVSVSGFFPNDGGVINDIAYGRIAIADGLAVDVLDTWAQAKEIFDAAQGCTAAQSSANSQFCTDFALNGWRFATPPAEDLVTLATNLEKINVGALYWLGCQKNEAGVWNCLNGQTLETPLWACTKDATGACLYYNPPLPGPACLALIGAKDDPRGTLGQLLEVDCSEKLSAVAQAGFCTGSLPPGFIPNDPNCDVKLRVQYGLTSQCTGTFPNIAAGSVCQPMCQTDNTFTRNCQANCMFDALGAVGGVFFTVAANQAGASAKCVAAGAVAPGDFCNIQPNANIPCTSARAYCPKSGEGIFVNPCAGKTECSYSQLNSVGVVKADGPGCSPGNMVAVGGTCTVTAVKDYTCTNPVCNAAGWSTPDLQPCKLNVANRLGQIYTVVFQGDLARFNRENARTILALGLGLSLTPANVVIVDVEAASVNVRFQTTGLSPSQEALAIAKLRANCATQLAQSGVDCNSIRPFVQSQTSCQFALLARNLPPIPSVATLQGQGCAVNDFVENGRSCLITLSNRNWFCTNPSCDAGQWSTLYPCRQIDADNDSLSGGTIAGIVIGCVLGVLGLVIVIVIAIAVTAPPKLQAVDSP